MSTTTSKGRETQGPQFAIVAGHYPSIQEITGFSFKISVVMSATDINFDEALKRQREMEFLVNACNSHAALVEALTKFVTAAKSWHETHGHGVNPIQCDWLCECIAPGEAALSRARGET